MSIPRIIAVDFDGTLCEHEFPGIGKAKPGAREALAMFRRAGYHVMIYSCRTSNYHPEIFNQNNEPLDMNRSCIVEMVQWLLERDIQYDSICDGTKGKPVADYYIDDKGIRFDNNWSEIAHAVCFGASFRTKFVWGH